LNPVAALRLACLCLKKGRSKCQHSEASLCTDRSQRPAEKESFSVSERRAVSSLILSSSISLVAPSSTTNQRSLLPQHIKEGGLGPVSTEVTLALPPALSAAPAERAVTPRFSARNSDVQNPFKRFTALKFPLVIYIPLQRLKTAT